MKMPMVFLLTGCLLLLPVLAEPSTGVPRLAGIVNLPGHKTALLEVMSGRSSGNTLRLAEGQREGEVEVLRIDPGTGSAELMLQGAALSVTPSFQRSGKDSVKSPRGSLELVDAKLDPVLRLEAEFRRRSLLRWPRLPPASFTLTASAIDEAQAALVLEKALSEKGIVTLPDGDKFLRVVPRSEVAKMETRSPESTAPIANQSQSELLPAGVINFPETDVLQVAQVYAELIGRKLERPKPLPKAIVSVHFRNQTPLTREECVYALDTLFRWQGVRIVPVGAELARVVSISHGAK